VDRSDVLVVTNSLLVAEVLMEAPDVEVHVTGGALRASIHALVGPAAEQALAGYRTRWSFISGNGLTAERGLTTPNPLVASADRALAAAAREVVVLADSTKIGQDAMCQTIPPRDMTHLIVDDGADPEELDRLRGLGPEVRVVARAAGRPGHPMGLLRPADA
jgi:DeoR/GlpR family transcriptional regulator of sugar metabolism